MCAAAPSYLFDQRLAGGVEADNADLGTVRGELFLRALQRCDRGQIPQVGLAQIDLDLRRHALVINAAPSCPAEAKNTWPRTR